MKLFKTSSMDIVKYCQHCFSFDLPRWSVGKASQNVWT